ncbi:glycosyltransferase family 4 protein [uncultured Selenomonas sp.]|uniref:glycosyltransferase family 4 protein n=1 Tax=uncultured Selenomonas sp. TaxID=159275 RepID=UPI0028E23941|nr:glycosyltransferase family 4 protein [uncultured Selenomonas sp.]
MKVAIVCDWLVVYAGAERVLEQFLNIWPQADIFCLVDFLPDQQRAFLKNKQAKTSFLQYFPGAKNRYRSFLPFMPLAIEQLDVTQYDLVLSSSHAVAKGVLTGPDQVHIAYIHSPIRYAWDLTHQYLSESGLNHGVKGIIAKCILHYIRIWDVRTANGVDYFIANSKFIARRIKKVYGRKAEVIYPPVDVDKFECCEEKNDYYLTASRLVPYKKVRLIVEAFNEMPNRKLIVIGDGPDYEKTKAVAKENVTMMGFQDFSVMKDKMQHAKAFVFAAEEDFGITPVEAQACGTPVIAFGKGGALETVCDGETGYFFFEQTKKSIIHSVEKFEMNNAISPYACRKNAERFSASVFVDRIQQFVLERMTEV